MAKRADGNIPEEFRVSAGTDPIAEPENNGVSGGINGASVNGTVINPAEIGNQPGSVEPGEGKRKRGRPKGGGTTAPKSEAAKTLHLKNLDFVILNAHLLLSKAISAPEFAIDKDEAETLGESVKEVLRQYDVGMSDKAAAWTNLIMVSTAVYGGRVFRMSERKAKEREEKRRVRMQEQAANNVSI